MQIALWGAKCTSEHYFGKQDMNSTYVWQIKVPTHNCLITESGTGRVSREEVLKMIQYQESPEFQREYQEEMESKRLRAEAWQRSHGFRPHPRHGRQHSPVFK